MICLAVIPTYIAVFSLAQHPALSCRPSPGAAEALLPVVYQQRCHRQASLIYGCLSVVTTSTLQQMGFRYLLSERTLLSRSDTINKMGITIYSIEIDGIPMEMGYNLLMCHTVEWSGSFGVCCSADPSFCFSLCGQWLESSNGHDGTTYVLNKRAFKYL